MVEPPDPKIPALLLAAAVRLGFLVISRDPSGLELGVLSDAFGAHPLVIAGGTTPNSCTWTLLGVGSTPKMSFLLTRATYDALRGGSLAEDGALVHKGTRHLIRATFEGTAELLQAPTAK